MLRKEQNDLLTQTGPGTPMGQMFRSHWLPALLAEELPENECPPVRVKLLSERLLAWRDTQGRLALTDEFCAHRGVSLWFGRNEHNGLRCPYHGWKYDHTGQCIEVPSEPEESGFCKKIKLKSYPLVERGGVLWTYMGPPEKQPPLPEWEFAMMPADRRLHVQAHAGMQLAAGDGRRHQFQPRVVPAWRRTRSRSAVQGLEGQPVQSRRHEAGVRSGRERRRAFHRRAPQRRERQLLLAHHAMGDADLHHDPAARGSSGARALLGSDRRRQLLGLELRLQGDAPAERKKRSRRCATARASTSPMCPARYRPRANKDNDYLVDRAAQKAGKTYSGVEGIAMQDASLQESMGPIVDRSKENLVSTDNGIIMARHRLLRALKTMEKGETPPGVDLAHQRVRSAAVVLPPDQPYKDAAKDALIVQPGKAHVSV